MSSRRFEQSLRGALPDLPPDARKIIVRRLEQKKARASDDQDLDEVLALIRELDPDRHSFPKRIPTPARLFFSGLEPFLWDLPDAVKQRGRIPRSALTPIWGWFIENLPTDALLAHVERAKIRLAAGQVEEASDIIVKARAKAMPLVRATLAEYRIKPKRWAEVGAGIDEPHTLDHVVDIVDIFENLKLLDRVSVTTAKGSDGGTNPFLIDERILERLPDGGQDLAYAKIAGQISNPVAWAAHFNAAVSFDTAKDSPVHPAIVVIEIMTADAMFCANSLTRSLENGDYIPKASTLIKRISNAVRFLSRLQNHPTRPWRAKLAKPLSELDEALLGIFAIILRDIETAFAPCHDGQLVVGPDMERMNALKRWGRLMRLCETSLELPQSSAALPVVKRTAMTSLEKTNAAIVQAMIADKDSRNASRFFDSAINVTGAVYGPKLASAWRDAGMAAVNRSSETDAGAQDPDTDSDDPKVYLS